MEKDFEVRNLSEYDIKDLEILLGLVRYAITGSKLSGHTDDLQYYDIWAYRIKDAISQAKKNGTITHKPFTENELTQL